jgi:hypothetical protein
MHNASEGTATLMILEIFAPDRVDFASKVADQKR